KMEVDSSRERLPQRLRQEIALSNRHKSRRIPTRPARNLQRRATSRRRVIGDRNIRTSTTRNVPSAERQCHRLKRRISCQVCCLNNIVRSAHLSHEPCVIENARISRSWCVLRIGDLVLPVRGILDSLNRTVNVNKLHFNRARVTIQRPFLSTRHRASHNSPLARNRGSEIRCSTSHIINRGTQVRVIRPNSDNLKMRPIVSSLIRVLKRSIPRHLHNRPIHMRRKSRRDRWDRAINMTNRIRPIILTTHNGGNIPVPILEREIPTILNRREISLSTTPR